MNKFVTRVLINAVAMFAAIFLLNGHGLNAETNAWWGFLILGVIFGVVNAVIRPILTVVSCPFILLTLGLGTLLINTLMFYLAGLMGKWFGVGFTVEGFVPAFLGALIVSVVSFILSWFLKDELKNH